jgi:probable phosphoglycerate mutase
VEETQTYRQYRFTAPPGATEILLVRHGESAPVVIGEPHPLVDGHGDPELAPEGVEQAERVADRLANERVDAIYVTNLRRTAQTAAPLARRLGLEPIVEPDFREVFLGEWEGGMFRVKVAENGPIAQRMWAEQRWDVIPGAESVEALETRLRTAMQRLVARHPDERVVVVSHGGVIGTLLSLASGATAFAFVASDNASVSQLVVLGDLWLVRTFNDTAHLDPRFTLRAEPLT